MAPHLMLRASAADVPVIINNRNRLSTLIPLVNWLEGAGVQRIVILDNASTYPPLLDHYTSSAHTVVHLSGNMGYLALWETPVWHEFSDQHYVYTDADVVPDETCPLDLIDRLLDVLQRFPQIEKAGPGLRIDDLPDSNKAKSEIMQRESVFWQRQVEPGLYDAPIDTTFALYRPGARGGYWSAAYRTGPPYIARHLSWYIDSEALDPEETFYRAHSNQDSYWTARS
jgi:hypothetical protein